METFRISGFSGLDQVLEPGSDSKFTRNLDGVEVRRGRVIGAGGTSKFLGITDVSATTPIIKLFLYTGYDYAAKVLRMTPTKVFVLDPLLLTWTDVTGTDLTGFSTTRPQWCTHKGVTVFTNEQEDLPRKYTGTGNTATLGGEPPLASVICDYMKFLFLWNVITAEGTFPRQGLYSDDYDNDWSSCNGFELNLDETPGEVRAALALGTNQVVYKADGVAVVRFVGGQVRFQQEMLPFDEGIIAPASLKAAGNIGHIFLATDYQLYTLIGGQIKALPPRVADILQKDMDLTYAPFISACVNSDTDTYYLFYRTTVEDDFKRGRIAYNFRTGEFAHRTYAGHEFLDALGFKFFPNSAERVIASANDLVYELNDTTTTPSTDDGTAIDRRWTSDWQDFGADINKYLRRVDLQFKRAPRTRVKISIAVDQCEEWLYEQVFDLKGNPRQSTVTIEYEPPQPCEALHYNLQVRMFHDSTNVAELQSIVFHWDKASGYSNISEQHQIGEVR